MKPTLLEKLKTLAEQMQELAEEAEVRGWEEIFQVLDSSAFALRVEIKEVEK